MFLINVSIVAGSFIFSRTDLATYKLEVVSKISPGFYTGVECYMNSTRTHQAILAPYRQFPTERITEKPMKPKNRKFWSPKEKELMYSQFRKCFQSKTLPSLEECKRVARTYSKILKQRTPIQLYAWIQSEFRRKDKGEMSK